jgi:hypothetical protein
VLNLQTGLVSSQFHVQFHNYFETVRPEKGNAPTFSQWQVLYGFKSTSAQQSSEGASKTPSTDTPNASRGDLGGTLFEPSVNQESLETSDKNSEPEMSLALRSSDDAPAIQPQHTIISIRGRKRKLTQRMQESIETGQIDRGITLQTFLTYYEAMHEDDLILQDEMLHPFAFVARQNKDTLYYDQAMSAPDADEFKKAIIKEVNAHIENKHWDLVP